MAGEDKAVLLAIQLAMTRNPEAIEIQRRAWLEVARQLEEELQRAAGEERAEE